MARECAQAPLMQDVGPMIHVTCACGIDYYVVRS